MTRDLKVDLLILFGSISLAGAVALGFLNSKSPDLNIFSSKPHVELYPNKDRETYSTIMVYPAVWRGEDYLVKEPPLDNSLPNALFAPYLREQLDRIWQEGIKIGPDDISNHICHSEDFRLNMYREARNTSKKTYALYEISSQSPTWIRRPQRDQAWCIWLTP